MLAEHKALCSLFRRRVRSIHRCASGGLPLKGLALAARRNQTGSTRSLTVMILRAWVACASSARRGLARTRSGHFVRNTLAVLVAGFGLADGGINDDAAQITCALIPSEQLRRSGMRSSPFCKSTKTLRATGLQVFIHSARRLLQIRDHSACGNPLAPFAPAIAGASWGFHPVSILRRRIPSPM